MSDRTPDHGAAADGNEGVRSRPWHRASEHRCLGGVAAGTARWLELDPLFVRVGLVVLATFWPPAMFAYLALWLVLPSHAGTRPLVLRAGDPIALRELLAVLALALAVVLLLPDLRPGGSRTLQVGIVLVAAGLMLLTRAPLPDAAPVPASVRQQTTSIRTAAAARSTPLTRTRAVHPSPLLTPLALSLLLVGAGLAAAVEWVGGAPLSPGTAVSIVMVLVGGTLVASAWWGRARALIALVPPLALAWVAFAPGDVPRHPGFGERTYTVTSLEDLRDRYAHGVGVLTVDATGISLRDGQQVTVHAAITAGAMEVNVPFDAVLRLEGRVGLGQVEVWDDRIGASYRQYDSGPSAGRSIDRRLEAMTPFCWPTSGASQLDQQGGAAEDAATSTVTLPADQGASTTEPAPPGPATTSTTTAATTTTAVSHQTPHGEPCQPEELPSNPPVITIRLQIGAGALEVHRVEAPD